VKVFLTELDTVADKCEIMLRPLDKKQEKYNKEKERVLTFLGIC
jgi:hypothetical protein